MSTSKHDNRHCLNSTHINYNLLLCIFIKLHTVKKISPHLKCRIILQGCCADKRIGVGYFVYLGWLSRKINSFKKYSQGCQKINENYTVKSIWRAELKFFFCNYYLLVIFFNFNATEPAFKDCVETIQNKSQKNEAVVFQFEIKLNFFI